MEGRKEGGKGREKKERGDGKGERETKSETEKMET